MTDQAEEAVEIDDVEEPTEQTPEVQPELPEGHKLIDGVEYVTAELNSHEVNKQHKRFRDEERARQRIESELNESKTRLQQLEKERAENTIPPVPDPLDEQYEAKIQERDDAIRLAAKQDSAIEQEKETQSQAQPADSDQAGIEEKIRTFDTNMVKLGLNPTEVKQAADTIVEYGITEALEDVILQDPNGALMTQYFANNPIELDKFNKMTPYEIFTNLDGLRQKASLLKPQTSKAPDPPDVLQGGGVPEMEDPLLKGVTFE